MSSTLRRAAFALRFGEYNLLGSGLITKDSRILYIRDVRERVQMLAPFLDFDADPYPVINERAAGLGDRRLHDELALPVLRERRQRRAGGRAAACATRTTTCATR